MSAALRRGACPSLSAPMKTGDGMLVRLNPKGGSLTAGQLAGIADAAAEFGNGMLEITSRGSLQCRGLSPATAGPFAAAIAALGIEAEDAPEIRLPPLAGRDATELGDPRPLASRLRAQIGRHGIARFLAPKLSIVIDSGGTPSLAGLQADIRLHATPPAGRWLVMVGGDAETAVPLGIGTAEDALAAAMAVLDHLAATGPAARGRDIAPERLADFAQALAPGAATSGPPTSAIGTFPLDGGSLARGFALPFAQIAAADLAGFAIACGEAEIRLAPGGALLVLGLADAQTIASAESFGLVADASDPRLRLFACAGAPGCASSHLQTKAMARAFAAQAPELLAELPKLHISGCSKQCARPAGPHLSLIGTGAGVEIEAVGTALPAAAQHRLTQFTADISRQETPA